MHEKSPILTVTRRTRLGTRYAVRDRANDRLPAIVYGHKKTPSPITVPMTEAITHFEKGEKIFRLTLPDEKAEQVVLLKDIQFDYLGTNIMHADFTRVDLNERVETSVHLELIGEAVGLKSAGAVLLHPTTDLEIECRVSDLPDMIEVDISTLGVDGVITASDIKLPKDDMKLLSDESAVVAQVVIIKEEEAAEETELEAGASEPEVITEKKEDKDD